MERVRNKKAAVVLLGIFYAVCIAALYVRNMLGIDIEDEPYHVSSVFQVLQGKVPLMSIWDGHTGYFLLAPFAALYRVFSPNLDGVVLYFRMVGLTIGLLALGFNIYLLWRKYRDPALPWFFLPVLIIAQVLSLSYNTVSALLVLTIGVLLYTSDPSRREWGRYLAIGILSGLLCVTYPTYTLIALFILGYVFFKNRKTYGGVRLIVSAAGMAAVGFGFFAWIFARGSWSEFAAALNGVLHAPHTDFRGPIDARFFYRTFLLSAWKFVRRKYSIVLVLYLAALVAIWKFLPKEKRAWYGMLAYGVYALAAVFPNRTGYGYAISGLVVGMLALLTMLGRKCTWDHFIFYALEILFVLIYSFTSDNKNFLLGVSASNAFLALLLCLFFYEYVRSERPEGFVKLGFGGKGAAVVLSALLAAVGLAHAYGFIYGDASLLEYGRDTRVTTGVFEGMYTTKERKAYLEELERFVDANVTAEDSLCVITLEPMVYLMTGAEIYTPWTFDAQYLFKGFFSDKPLTDYFAQYGRYPDVLFGTDKHNPDFETNPDYAIKDFIAQHYTLTETAEIDGVHVWLWRLNGPAA